MGLGLCSIDGRWLRAVDPPKRYLIQSDGPCGDPARPGQQWRSFKAHFGLVQPGRDPSKSAAVTVEVPAHEPPFILANDNWGTKIVRAGVCVSGPEIFVMRISR